MAVIRSLSEEALREVAEVVRRVLGESIDSIKSTARHRQGGMAYVGKTAAGLSAGSGSTLGTGTVTLQNATDGVISNRTTDDSANVDVTAYNVGPDPVIANTVNLYVKEMLTGKLIQVPSMAVGYKPLVRFTIATNSLTTSEASNAATITNQYGYGYSNTTAAGGITVHNLLTSAAGVYVFEGDVGDAGLAMWDTGTNYRIIQMECA